MATFFKNKVIQNVGTATEEIYTTDGNTRATVIGLSITNLLESQVFVDILITDETSTDGFYLKDSVIPASSSLRAVNQGEKLILAPNNGIKVRSSVDNSVDVVLSFVEIV